MLSIEERTLNFAARIFYLSKQLREVYHEYSLADQILRSGTSIGANYEEARGAISKADFIAKTSISLKEARETRYWLKLFFQIKLIDNELYTELLGNCNSIINILGKAIRTVQTQKSINQIEKNKVKN